MAIFNFLPNSKSTNKRATDDLKYKVRLDERSGDRAEIVVREASPGARTPTGFIAKMITYLGSIIPSPRQDRRTAGCCGRCRCSA